MNASWQDERDLDLDERVMEKVKECIPESESERGKLMENLVSSRNCRRWQSRIVMMVSFQERKRRREKERVSDAHQCEVRT